MNSFDVLEVFYKEPEQLIEGQQPITYHNGCALELLNREQAREAFTREELEEIYDRQIARQAKQWGENYIYTNWARETKLKNMQDWEEGKVVHVYSEEYHKDCMDWADTYYSDGTKVTCCYGYSD